MRARSASSSPSGVTGIANGRIMVVPADFSVEVDMRVSLFEDPYQRFCLTIAHRIGTLRR
jgi:hypothetical protein